jgi:hypothetical protein
MEFLRTRTLAYLIGAFEFADNFRLNLVDKFLPYERQENDSWKQLEGKVRP